MKNMNRSAAIKYAASLPKGDPTRREIIARLRSDKIAGSDHFLVRWQSDRQAREWRDAATEVLKAKASKFYVDGSDIRFYGDLDFLLDALGKIADTHRMVPVYGIWKEVASNSDVRSRSEVYR